MALCVVFLNGYNDYAIVIQTDMPSVLARESSVAGHQVRIVAIL